MAVQRPVYQEYRVGLGFDLRDDLRKYPTNSQAKRVASERVADSLLTHDPYYSSIFVHKTNYWVIAHGPRKVYGPLTYPQYVQQARTLQVPDRLTLEAEPEYRPREGLEKGSCLERPLFGERRVLLRI